MFNAYEYVNDEMRKAMVRTMLAAQFLQQAEAAAKDPSEI